MSQIQDLATVTEGLRARIDEVFATDPVTVTTLTPDQFDRTRTGVNIALVRAGADPTHRNQDLPFRRRDGAAVVQPRLTLQLDYLITFTGSSTKPQSLLGKVMTALHGDTTVQLEAGPDGTTPEPVRLTLRNLDLDALVKLWSGLTREPYCLSVAYRVGPVSLGPPD